MRVAVRVMVMLMRVIMRMMDGGVWGSVKLPEAVHAPQAVGVLEPSPEAQHGEDHEDEAAARGPHTQAPLRGHTPGAHHDPDCRMGGGGKGSSSACACAYTQIQGFKLCLCLDPKP